MNKYPQIFYTSDLHIGHRFVAGTRGFLTEEHADKVVDFNNKAALPPDVREWTDPDAHNKWLADIWDNTVRDIDIVYVLGDMSIDGKQECLDWIEARPGKKNLVSGNHDPVHPMFSNSEKSLKHWRPYFADIQPFQRRKLAGVDVLLSHFPYSGTGAEGHGVTERHTQYRLPDLGAPLLHGHTHGPEKEHYSDNGTPQLHVGIDAWGELVPQDVVIEWAKRVTAKPKAETLIFV